MVARGLTAASGDELEAAIDEALASCGARLDADAVCLIGRDGSDDTYRRIRAWSVRPEALPEPVPLTREQLVVSRVDEAWAVNVTELSEGAPARPWLESHGAGRAAIAPVRAADDLAGALVVLWSEGDESMPLASLLCLGELVFAAVARCRAEDEARRARERERLLFAANPHPMFVYDLETLAFLDANEAALRRYGYSRDELLAMTIRDIRPEADVGPLTDHVATHTMSISDSGVWRHRKKSGEIIYVDVVSHALTFDERPARIVTARDLTEQYLAQEALRASEEKYRQIVETAEEGVWLIDERIETTFVNARMAEMVGYEPGEMLGRSMYDFMDDEARKEAEANVGKRQKGVRETHAFRLRKKDGGDLWTLMSANPVLSDDGRFLGALAMVTDITDRRALEARLAQAHALEAVGRLAGGIAHDFNNLLTIIYAYTSMAPTLTGERLESALEGISDAAERGSELTARLLALAQRHPTRVQALDPNEVIDRSSRLIARSLGDGIELDVELSPDVWQVLADESQLERALLDLAGNARDAMPDGGQLRVSTRNIDESQAPSSPMEPAGDRVAIEVRDTGPGLSEEARARIFEPFFSTRARDIGAGLGLASAYGIVLQFGGSIECESADEHGTTFTICLPRAVCPSVDAGASLSTEPMPAEESVTILYVEDEPQLRRLWPRLLRDEGYEVLVAEDGERALEVAEGHEDSIHVLVTDVVMPRMSGYVAADRIRALRPDMKVLYMSGYSHEEVPDQALARPGTDFLPKPFAADELIARIRGLLCQGGADVRTD